MNEIEKHTGKTFPRLLIFYRVQMYDRKKYNKSLPVLYFSLTMLFFMLLYAHIDVNYQNFKPVSYFCYFEYAL